MLEETSGLENAKTVLSLVISSLCRLIVVMTSENALSSQEGARVDVYIYRLDGPTYVIIMSTASIMYFQHAHFIPLVGVGKRGAWA